MQGLLRRPLQGELGYNELPVGWRFLPFTLKTISAILQEAATRRILPPMENHPKHILAIETATPVCSASLLAAGADIISRRTEGSGRHAEKLLPFINELFNESGIAATDLGAVAVSAGPGSFTGLRVASSTVKGLLYGRDIPVISCNTLAGIAWGASVISADARRINTVLDARRHHLYYQSFRTDGELPQPEREMKITDLDEFPNLINGGEVMAGTGIERLPDLVKKSAEIIGYDAISAENLIRMAEKWIATGAEDNPVISWSDAAIFQPDYYSQGPPKPAS